MTENLKFETKKEGDFLRIFALKNFGNVVKGDKGGLVEREGNLSQFGDAWVSGNARVYDNEERS